MGGKESVVEVTLEMERADARLLGLFVQAFGPYSLSALGVFLVGLSGFVCLLSFGSGERLTTLVLAIVVLSALVYLRIKGKNSNRTIVFKRKS